MLAVAHLSSITPALPIAFTLFPRALLADISSLPWVAIVAVGGGMLIAIVVIVGGLIIAHHRQRQWHETARLALEKGQPLPQSLDDSDSHKVQGRPEGPGRDLRAGLICIGTGAGLFLFFDALLGRWMAYVGAIPGFIGIALVLYAILDLAFGRKNASTSDRPPQS